MAEPFAVPPAATPAGGSRLGRLIRAADAASRFRRADPEAAACELCAAAIPAEHRHLLDVEHRRTRCVCRACALLFDDRAAGGERYRLVPEGHRRVEGFRLDDGRWQDLAIPVGLAYFVRGSREDRVTAFYPGALGATESRLGLEAWADLEADNPVLAGLQPDVEALLVLRVGGAREHWLVPIDACFRLVALVRTRWRGLSGGSEAWQAVGAFFDDLRRRARPVDRRGQRTDTTRSTP